MTTRAAFLGRSASIDEDIRRIEEQIQDTKVRDLPPLKRKLESARLLREAINGFKGTPEQKDPGKYGKAWYFVGVITTNDMVSSDQPTLYHACDGCGKKQPVIMTYEQTFDSPEGDTWTKDAFTICCTGRNNIARVERDYRFLVCHNL